MSKKYEFECLGHNSIYKYGYEFNNYNKRKFNVYVSEPENGIDNETGVLLLIPGFGGEANSKIYKKMRTELSDKYNLVVVQCDYFGNKFMQDVGELELIDIDIEKIEKLLSDNDKIRIFGNGFFNLDELINTNLSESISLKFERKHNETLNEFNDMGIMQAIDNITATLSVINLIYEKKKIFNTNKIMIMGQSHGSYLAYLCNVLCPNLYTHILDNSAWNIPLYLRLDRITERCIGNVNMLIKHNYFIKNNLESANDLSIEKIYENFENKCKIYSYHGIDDKLMNINDKEAILKNIKNTIFFKIGLNEVDDKVFKTTTHGLGADFMKLFEKFYEEIKNVEVSNDLRFENSVCINEIIKVDYTNGLPTIDVLEKN